MNELQDFENQKIILTFGGGTNSTAILVELYRKGIRPDYIIFADTGGERPHTYNHIQEVQGWLRKVGFPEIVTVKKVDKNGDVLTLEEDCLKNNSLPSLVYGFKTCSQKYKTAPVDKFFNNLKEVKNEFKEGRKVIKLIGFDAGEERRAKDYSCDKYTVKYPLISWGWDRGDCIAAISQAGIRQPKKSSCFFCPSSTQAEIREMQAVHPDLVERAIKMEKNAILTQAKGLGRRFSWSNIIATDDMFPESYIDNPCGCYDG